ncbi:hypothetical protein BD770DRAFT_445101 [Pilaira anomala]|nr:hypothetical protein BD770DRAFT_445101 [Pilaira anomala]
MPYATTFDTNNGIWSEDIINGSSSIIPNGNDISLYGGASGSGTKAVLDYCFTLNISNISWTFHDLAAPSEASGSRAQYSAVLVNDTSLFILFGRDMNGDLVNQLLVLDVRNAALAILGIACCFRNQKTQQTGTRPGSTSHFDTQQNNENETLEADRDKIENHYREDKEIPLLSDDTYFEANISTVMSASQSPHTSTTTKPETRLAGVSSNLYKSKPNIAEPIHPDIFKPSIVTKLLKPDGSV